MTPRTHLLPRPALLAAAALLVAGCSSGPQAPAPRAVPVRTVTVAPGTLEAAGREYVGVVEEESATALSFPVAGTVAALTASEGQRVGEGQLLGRLDERNLQSIHNSARATLAQAEDAMRRLQMLHDNGSLPEIKYVEAQTQLEQARSLEQVARKNLGDSRLAAPFSGVIGRKTVEAGENVMPGQSVYTLLKTGTVKVRIAVPENEIAALGTGREAHITVAALGGKAYTGTVQEKGAAANPISHTYEARIPLANPRGELMPGMVCRVTLGGDTTAQAVTLPNSAVQVSGRGDRFVWCVRDGEAVRVPVTVGALTDSGVLVTRGLEKGDRVIVEGMQKVSQGTKVEVL